jgi:hypothetical protein
VLVHKIPALWLRFADPEKPVDHLVDFGLSGIKFSLVFFEEQMVPGIQKEKTEKVQNPMKPVDQFNAHSNENDAEYDGQQNAYQQCTSGIGFFYPEISEDQDEHKNIVNAQRPFHQVGRKEFGGHHRGFLEQQKDTKCNRKTYPKNGLPQGFFHADGGIFLAHQSKVKHQGTQKHNPKSQVSNLINGHFEYQLLGNKDNHSRMPKGYPLRAYFLFRKKP